MKYDDKYLEMLLHLIEKIDKVNGSTWFSSSLLDALSDKNIAEIGIVTQEINEIYSDIKRTKYFLRNVDRRDWLEGFRYYEKIKIPQLKIELIKDFKEMKIADKENDVIEYTRRLVMQLENCINCLIELLDTYNIIRQQPHRYQDNYNNLLNGRFAFFDEKNGNKKKLKDITFPSKIYFAKQYYSFNYDYKDFDEMVLIRNKASHRGGMNEKELLIIETAINNPTQKKVNYFKVFDTILKNLKDLFE